jgi:molybdenum cofactor guanylyltransferase
MEANGIILAGGQSSRMGKNKALLRLNNETMIERIVKNLETFVDDVIIVTNGFEDYRFLGLPMVEDRWKGMGPLAGIEAGLHASRTEKNLVVACDMPFISQEWGEYLLSCLDEYQAAVPKISGMLHPLFASYRKEVGQKAGVSLQENTLRMRDFFDNIHVKIVHGDERSLPKEEKYFFNMNHFEQYEQALRMAEKRNNGSGGDIN